MSKKDTPEQIQNLDGVEKGRAEVRTRKDMIEKKAEPWQEEGMWVTRDKGT